jgi:hypothetical protein
MADFKFCFLFSNWYSGATLLSLLLDNHPALTCNGETFPFSSDAKYICSCGKPLVDCMYYRTVCEHMFDLKKNNWNYEIFRKTPKFSTNQGIQRILAYFLRYSVSQKIVYGLLPSKKRQIEVFRENHLAFFRKSCSYFGSNIYIDGTKSIWRAGVFTSDPKFSQIIILLRDSRGYCKSYLKNENKERTQVVAAAETWNVYISEVDDFIKRNPNIQPLFVRYEDLCVDSHATMALIFDFLGIEIEDYMKYSPSRESHMLGNRMRSAFDGTIKEDISWQTYFTNDEISKINKVTEAGLKRFNYNV